MLTPATPTLDKIVVSRRAANRISGGFPWVYSNEIDGKLKGFSPGVLVDVLDERGQWLARGYLNPHTLIAVRILSRVPDEPIDRHFFEKRFRIAHGRRDQLLGRCVMCREVHGEADHLPGLVVDRYGGLLVLQIRTQGMHGLQEHLISAVRKCYEPQAIVVITGSRSSDIEGLPRTTTSIEGDPADPYWVSDHGLWLPIDIFQGQKTGYFLDQEANRQRVAALAGGGELLDLFCYTGAFALRGLQAGAKYAVLVDSSRRALDIAREALVRNRFQQKFDLVCTDALPQLNEWARLKRKFALISSDPPAFAKTKADREVAITAYEKLAGQLVRILAPGGWLSISSCSYHVDRASFLTAIGRGISRAAEMVCVVSITGAGEDHPIDPLLTDTDYLKAVLCSMPPEAA